MLGSRFAPVVSVRALLNSVLEQPADKLYDARGVEFPRPRSFYLGVPQPTCRGVGFILFHSIDDAAKGIIGLNGLGFDASYAKVGILACLRSI